MGTVLQQTAGAGAPEIDDGLAQAIFNGITPESHPDWAGPNKFGGLDDGERWRFGFTVVDDAGAIVYDEGEPLEVTVLTQQTMGKKSNAYALMKGILNKAELALIDAGEPLDSSDLEGRRVQIVVAHNDKGWPLVDSVIPVQKKAGAKERITGTAAAAATPAKASTADLDAEDKAAAKAARLAAIQAELAELEGED